LARGKWFSLLHLEVFDCFLNPNCKYPVSIQPFLDRNERAYSLMYGIKHRNFRSVLPVFLNWCLSSGGMKTTSLVLNGDNFSPSKTAPSPSRMKTSCSQGCVCKGVLPPGSISKSLMAKLLAPMHLVMSFLICTFEGQQSAFLDSMEVQGNIFTAFNLIYRC
jgi:hypothetical protein